MENSASIIIIYIRTLIQYARSNLVLPNLALVS